MTSLRRSFLAMKRDVAKTASSIALRIDAVVLHAPARCDLYLAGFDERRQRARQPHPSAGDIGLGDENAVQQRVNVILQQRFRQQPQIDRRVLGDGEFLLQRVGKALVAAFEDVWAVEPVSFEQRVSDLVTEPPFRTATYGSPRNGATQSFAVASPGSIFQPIGHALRRLDQQHLGAIRQR